MNTPAAQSRYRVDPSARFRVLDDEGIFVLQKAGEVLVINKTGAMIIEQLNAHQTVEQAALLVAQRFDVDLGRATDDALALIAELQEAGALIQS